MRAVIVGDLQYRKGECIEDIAKDLDTLNADALIIVGDYGYWDGFGSYEVFNEINEAFKNVKCKHFIPLLGNHDVQFEAGEVSMKQGTVAHNYKKAFGEYPTNQMLEFENFRILCLHMEPQKKNDFYFLYECYISDENYENACAMLEDDNDKPTIVITHAPPVVSGLLTVPMTHVRAANAYLNQDHSYEKWRDMAKKYEQIIMWFSGHYHIGHSYPDSMTISDGTAYFVVGSASSGTRDGLRHTRVIDEVNGEITVSTYDHDLKRIYDVPDYRCATKKCSKAPAKAKKHIFEAGCGRVVENGLKIGANGRVYAMTDNDLLWEIDIVDGFAAGTLHYSDIYKLDGFSLDDEYVWRFCGDKAFGHRYSDKNRFMREKDIDICKYVIKERSQIKENRHEECIYKSRAACKVNENLICSAFNDGNGKLYFEISEIS